MKMSETRINHGGLMRCCLATLGNMTEADEEVEVDQVVSCAIDGHSQMFLDDNGIWHWKRD